MVKFAKNGSNVTTAATKIARAYTGRKLSSQRLVGDFTNEHEKLGDYVLFDV